MAKKKPPTRLSTIPFSPGSEEEEEAYYREQRAKRAKAAADCQLAAAKELWAAIETQTVAYNAYQDSQRDPSLHPEGIDYHNWSVSYDVLWEAFTRVTGHEPETL